MTPMRLAAVAGERPWQSGLDRPVPAAGARAKALVMRGEESFAVLQAVSS
ncbi:hypothetical protein [Bradyrhizobium sp. CB1015]|nr:hypothetical protein [Bradyrhizobium sp. CB1015]UWU92650.1 hypothetical protein N2604_01375 [Bradyrhizobium sp. CB1015]